jgi:hypothetical protein
MLVVALARLRLIGIPFERDEGEYAYMGQLMLQGVPPYLCAYTMKLPGTHAAYAAIMALFGQSVGGVHLGLLIANGATTVLVFLSARRLLTPLAALTAAAVFAISSTMPSVLGLAAHATHFVTLAAMLGVLLLLLALDRGTLLLFLASGAAFGLAVLMKQAGVFFGIFGGLWLLYSGIRRQPVDRPLLIRRAGAFTAGAVAPIVATAIALQLAGVGDAFRLWTVAYAREYAGLLSPGEGWQMFLMSFPRVVAGAPLVWALALAGLVTLFASRSARPQAAFIGGFALFSALAVCPGFYFREHYFIVLLPAIGLLAGVAARALEARLRRSAATPLRLAAATLALAAIAVGHTLAVNRSLLFERSPEEACRELYGSNPFPESLHIAEYIRENSSPDARVAVIGSEPQIYFYSGRRSAAGHIYTYPLMEEQSRASSMQRDMIREIERSEPELVVYVNNAASWLARPDSDRHIFVWFHAYRTEHLELVGFIEMIDATNTLYSWGEEARSVRPRTPNWLTVYRRRAED